jgi:anti-anti-sigma regulatory factor
MPMLKIQRTTNGHVIFAVSGRLDADSVRELSAMLAQESTTRTLTLDLKDLVLIDRDTVGFLRACAAKGIELRNCPQYIQPWMACGSEGA